MVLAGAMTRKPEPIEWDETTTTTAAVPEEASVEEEVEHHDDRVHATVPAIQAFPRRGWAGRSRSSEVRQFSVMPRTYPRPDFCGFNPREGNWVPRETSCRPLP